VIAANRYWRTDPALNDRLGGTTGHLCLAVERIAATPAEKLHLHRETGAAAADMESGAVAALADRAGLPFAILRAICDPAGRDLPPAALVGLDDKGRVALWPLARSILRAPGQIGALIGLARDAAAARRALTAQIRAIGADAVS
jgi:adenosylhomocysteine nucleosidase